VLLSILETPSPPPPLPPARLAGCGAHCPPPLTRWLALPRTILAEALERMEYTLATDVWAYGILLWEIFSAGKMPYAGMTNAETKAQVINNNYRMPAPSGTPEQIQQLMAECWQYQEKDRPTMADIVIWFEDIKAFYPEESA